MQTHLHRARKGKRKQNRRAMCQALLDYIRAFTASNQRPPKQSEIASGLFSNRLTVARYVQKLTNEGYLRPAANLQGRAYNLQVLKPVYRISRKESV